MENLKGYQPETRIDRIKCVELNAEFGEYNDEHLFQYLMLWRGWREKGVRLKRGRIAKKSRGGEVKNRSAEKEQVARGGA